MSDVSSAAISAFAVIVSAGISYRVATASAKKEIEKLKLTWAHEDTAQHDREFSEMASFTIL